MTTYVFFGIIQPESPERCTQLALPLTTVEKMGYELHITRREHWADTETSDILLDEWLSYIRRDKELELTNGYNIKFGSETQFQNKPGFCEWNGHPTEKELSSRPWFAYWQGSIDTKNPDAATIRKMIQIALALDAKVQGDEGEIYTEEYITKLEVSQQQQTSAKQPQKRSWWKLW